MSKQQKPAAQSAPQRLPGDHLSAGEERAAHEATLSKIKGELEAERLKQEALDRAARSELSGSGVQLAQLQESDVQRAAAHEATVELVRLEMTEQNAVNPPRLAPMGIDDASIDLIKAELAKAHKRVVLPSG